MSIYTANLVYSAAATIANAVSSLSTPTGASGADISGWPDVRAFVIRIIGDDALNLDGAKLYGRENHTSFASWVELAELNNGATIAIPSGGLPGWSAPFYNFPVRSYDRLDVSGTVSANNITIHAIPLDGV